MCLQTTSLFLHWFPACVAWTERWHPDVHVREYNKKSSEAMAEWHEATLLDLVVLPMIPYLVWALLYYVKVCLHMMLLGLPLGLEAPIMTPHSITIAVQQRMCCTALSPVAGYHSSSAA